MPRLAFCRTAGLPDRLDQVAAKGGFL